MIVHTDLATVQAVNNEQVVSYQTGNTVHDLADAIGFVNVNGNVFTANGANLSWTKVRVSCSSWEATMTKTPPTLTTELLPPTRWHNSSIVTVTAHLAR